MARAQAYVPDGMPMEPPRFLTRPSVSLGNITKLTKLMLWPYGLFYIGLSVVVWNYFTPALARMQRFEIGWVAEIYVRNLVMVAVWVSAIHFWLYVRRAQGMRFKYDGQWLSTRARRFLWRNQAWDNAFWTLASAPIFWTFWEALLYWCYANEYIPHVRWSDGAGWVVYLVVMTVFSFWLVAGYFYVTHRFLHTRPMYRWAHYLHHKNVNTGPWSGLSMHPIEHLLYFSTPVFFLFIPANPFIIIVTQIFTGLAPSLGHSNFDRIVVAGDRTLPAGDYFHDLHHKYSSATTAPRSSPSTPGSAPGTTAPPRPTNGCEPAGRPPATSPAKATDHTGPVPVSGRPVRCTRGRHSGSFYARGCDPPDRIAAVAGRREGGVAIDLPLLDVFGEARFVEAFAADRTIGAWLDVEVALARAQAEAGVIPESAAETIRVELESVEIDHEQLEEGARLVGYPILPLLQQLGRSHPDVASWLHFGATTQDIMDTALVILLRDACRGIAHVGVELGDTLAALAESHRATPMAGRTHGQQAVPITFGMKVAGWLEEIARSLARLGEARAAAEVVQLYGAAGTSAAYGPLSAATRRRTAEILGLGCDDVPWHSVRDRLAQVAAGLGVLAAATSRIALEVIDLARSEIAEVREGGGRLAGASSTMPQKANPILSETIVGLSGMAGALAAVPLRAMTGRHERSAGEWQMEWDSLPLLVAYTGSSLARCGDLVAGLYVDRARMAANLDIDGGLIMAEALMIRLAPLLGRQEAHDVVYDLSAAARDSGVPLAEAARSFLADRGLAEQADLEPASYLGEAEAIVDTAVERWRTARRPEV